MALRRVAPKLPPEEYERKFAEITPPLSRQQALVEASRCLFCYDAPCTAACPTHIDVPAFIKKIATGNLKGSARVILAANILGHSCGRICPTEVLCEGACVMHARGEMPIQIGRLQRYAVDYVLEWNIRMFQPGMPNGRRVACVGSGPASLACAAELAKWGYQVTIFDKNPLPGGLNTYGIAAYKTRVRDSLREVELVEDLGVEFRQGVQVGKDISLVELEKQFDAIFIGVGLGETWDLKLPGENLEGVYPALEFIERTKVEAFHHIDVGHRVAVIGAGNTAIDAATAAARLGAEQVYILYRRSEREMPAFKYEFELAKKDGVHFLWQAAPVRILGQRAVEGLECARMKLGEPDASGRCRPEPIPGSEFVLDVDMVVGAIGQQPVFDLLRNLPGVELHGDLVKVSESGQTTNPRYFAGGDCVNGGKEVVDAVAEGMRAARGIHEFVKPQMNTDKHR